MEELSDDYDSSSFDGSVQDTIPSRPSFKKSRNAKKPVTNANHKYQFAYDLQAIDGEISFSKQVVVAIEISNDCYNKTWDELKELLRSPNASKYVLSKPRIIPRCKNGQVYLFEGFRRFLHFSIGPIAFVQFKKVFGLGKVQNQVSDDRLLLISNVGENSKDFRMKKAMLLATTAGKRWLVHLLQCKKSSKRVPYNINFGFTDRK